MKLTLDSNVLIYAADADAGERHDIAVQLVTRAARADCVQTLQCFAEFFNVTTRKGGLSIDEAMAFIDDWRAVFPICAADETSLLDAVNGVRRYGLSFWDAMLWATARQAGCQLLLSEDVHDGQILSGLRVLNPFNPQNQALLDSALPESRPLSL